jgi:hypothetical protein
VLRFMFRSYWSVELFVAAVLLSVGTPSADALAAAGFAFLSAAITRYIDIEAGRRAETTRSAAQRRADLDETRRLRHAAL